MLRWINTNVVQLDVQKSQVTINGEEEHDITINEHDVDDEAQNHKTNKM